MSISAASFLYIALADLSPELHGKVDVNYAITQSLNDGWDWYDYPAPSITHSLIKG
jgi:hypothetical protein